MAALDDQLQKLLDAVERLAGSQAEGLDPAQAAAFLGVSLRKLHQMNDDGALPAPMSMGERCPRWSRTELRAWMLAECPSRSRWIQMREIKLRHVG